MSTQQEAQTENFLAKNLECLARYNKSLADKIAEHEITSPDYRLDFTKCDDLNLYINGYPVHDEVDAIGQAHDVFKNSYKEGHVHILYGLGLGYLFNRFVKEAKERIIVYEPNLDILRITLGIFDFSEALSNSKIKIVHDKFNIKPAIETVSGKGDQLTIYFLPYHGHFFGQEIQEFVKELSLINSLIEVGFKELANKSKNWALFTAKNLKQVSKNEELDALSGKFKDKPAIVVSAGPSLNGSIETIKKYRDKIVVIAVGVALKTLLANGIKPDFCVIIEIGNCILNVEGADVSGINFIFPPEVNPMIYDYNYKRKFNYYTENLFTSDWVADFTKVDCSPYINRGTVSITALWSAKLLGCNPIILTGQDLAYQNGRCYAGSAFFGLSVSINQETGEAEFTAPEFETQKKELMAKYFNTEDPEAYKQILKDYIDQKKSELTNVKGQNGELLPTSAGYALFVKHFEELIPVLEDKTLFNCSKGGAQLDGYENAEMEDVLSKYATKKIDVEKTILKSLKEYEKPASFEHKIEFINNNINMLTEYIYFADKCFPLIKKFNQQLKRVRSVRDDIKTLCYKALDIYIAVAKKLYAPSRYIMSLSYKEYLEMEEALTAFEKSRTDEDYKNLMSTLNNFFVQAKNYSEASIAELKNVLKDVNEDAASKG